MSSYSRYHFGQATVFGLKISLCAPRTAVTYDTARRAVCGFVKVDDSSTVTTAQKA